MKNYEIARQFDLMADVLELPDENPFRIRAYRRAARNLESLTEDGELLGRRSSIASGFRRSGPSTSRLARPAC
jgi:DNA polymerase (family X)